MSTSKSIITKQIIKSTFDVIQFIDDANGFSEFIKDEPKVIEFKDHMKDIFEERRVFIGIDHTNKPLKEEYLNLQILM